MPKTLLMRCESEWSPILEDTQPTRSTRFSRGAVASLCDRRSGLGRRLLTSRVALRADKATKSVAGMLALVANIVAHTSDIHAANTSHI